MYRSFWFFILDCGAGLIARGTLPPTAPHRSQCRGPPQPPRIAQGEPAQRREKAVGQARQASRLNLNRGVLRRSPSSQPGALTP